MAQALEPIARESGYEQLRYEMPGEPSRFEIFSREPEHLLISLSPIVLEIEPTKDTVVTFLCRQLREFGEAIPQRDDTYGVYILLILDLNASDALKIWKERIAPLSRHYGIWIAVRWKGKNDVDRSTLLDTLAEIMIESGFEPRASEPFDAVELVGEVRD